MDSVDISDEMVTADELWQWIELSNRLGPRFTGSPAHTAYVNWLADGFAASGLQVARHAYDFTRWQANHWSLSVILGLSSEVGVPVASYYPHSGSTPETGVIGRLLNLGNLASAEVDATVLGRVLYVTCKAVANWRPASARHWGLHDPQGTGPSLPALLATRQWDSMQRLRNAGAAFGAVGLLIGWENLSEENAAGQYQPLGHLTARLQRQGLALAETEAPAAVEAKANHLPALWLGPEGQSALFSGGEAPLLRLTLSASIHAGASTETLVATLEGSSPESVIVISHSDGVNACQENGGIAQIALASHFARMPLLQRERTLIFVVTSGHFAGGLTAADSGSESAGESEDVLRWHPHMLRNAVAVLGVEQLGVRNWRDDGHSYCAGHAIEFAHCATNSEALARVTLSSFKTTNHCALTVTGPPLWGHAARFSSERIAALVYMGIPNYVLATAPDGHLGKLSPARVHEEVLSLAKIISAIDKTPIELLREIDPIP